MIRTILDLMQPYSVSSLRHQREQSRDRAERLGLEKRDSRMFQREIIWWREVFVASAIVIISGSITVIIIALSIADIGR